MLAIAATFSNTLTTVSACLFGSFLINTLLCALSTPVSKNDSWSLPKIVSSSKYPGSVLASAIAGRCSIPMRPGIFEADASDLARYGLPHEASMHQAYHY